MNILITGGTGSLGRALIKEIYGKHSITVFSRDETKQGILKRDYPDCHCILGDIASLEELELAFRGIDVVYHFAAYKQVPAAQNNVQATVKTNILGSKNVVHAALKNNVRQVVASSTDKACQPVNVYGASKSVMESIFQDANKYGPTTFHLARYGNVVGSNGSVIPLFKKQTEMGGPLTITVKDMTRFWISIKTAVDLVNHALTVAPGIIVVPKAKALGIEAVANIVSGGLPTVEIGIRAGEKVHEFMVSPAESFHTQTARVFNVENIKEVFYIYPPTTALLNHSETFEYTSDSCERLTELELMDMITTYEN